jgi:hypothetical protein
MAVEDVSRTHWHIASCFKVIICPSRRSGLDSPQELAAPTTHLFSQMAQAAGDWSLLKLESGRFVALCGLN